MIFHFVVWVSVVVFIQLFLCLHGFPLISEENLSPEIASHKFVFVIGTHHSGTSLMNLMLQNDENVSGLKNTNMPEDEGQHLQSLYKQAYALGGMLRYAFNEQSYMDETHPLAQPENRMKLYNSWAPYWNLNSTYLLEKSPRHTVMTRFLQYIFTPSRSYFVIVLRHPFGSSHFRWRRRPKVSIWKDCGRSILEHWLLVHDTLRRDLNYLKNGVVVQMESFLSKDTELQANKIFEFLGEDFRINVKIDSSPLPTRRKRSRKPKKVLRGGVYVTTEPIEPFKAPTTKARAYNRKINNLNNFAGGDHNVEHAASTPSPAEEAKFFEPGLSHLEAPSQQQRRRLLHYRGDRDIGHLTINVGSEFAWAKEWEHELKSVDPAICNKVYRDFESRVRDYGYSLVDLRTFSIPSAFKKFYLHGAES